VNAATTYGSEGIGQDGGFAVPPDFRETILSKVTGEASLYTLCDRVPTAGSSLTVPKDETAPWGTGGVRAFWDGEASVYTQSKIALEKSTIPVHKLTCLVPVTDELLEDAPSLGSYVPRKAGDVIDQRVSDVIVDGSGAGQPLGILQSASLVTQAAEASQVADTIHGLNLVKMWTRMPAAWRRSAVWLVHPDAEAELMRAGLQIKSPDGTVVTGGGLAYVPGGTIANQPYDTLFSRPVIPHQSCKVLGDPGDLVFAALSQYAAVIRGAGLRTDVSIHLFFDQSITAFRFTFRMGGQPWWSAPITDKNGSTTRSAFVVLAAR
jgi:HK97 family phage major capsid protein